MMNANTPYRLQPRFTLAALVVALLAPSCGHAGLDGQTTDVPVRLHCLSLRVLGQMIDRTQANRQAL